MSGSSDATGITRRLRQLFSLAVTRGSRRSTDMWNTAAPSAAPAMLERRYDAPGDVSTVTSAQRAGSAFASPRIGAEKRRDGHHRHRSRRHPRSVSRVPGTPTASSSYRNAVASDRSDVVDDPLEARAAQYLADEPSEVRLDATDSGCAPASDHGRDRSRRVRSRCRGGQVILLRNRFACENGLIAA